VCAGRDVERDHLAYHAHRLFGGDPKDIDQVGGFVARVLNRKREGRLLLEIRKVLHRFGLSRGPLIGEMRLTQIELALDPAPCLVLKLTAAKEFVDAPPFGSNQKKLDLITKLRALSMAIMVVISILRVLEPVVVVRPEWLNDVLEEIAFGGKLIKALDRCLDPLPASLVLFDSICVPL
jgi:hypothetical protein